MTTLPTSALDDRPEPSDAKIEDAIVPADRGMPRTLAEISEEAKRLPKRINGGFQGVAEDLGRHSREATNMLRVLEQQRVQLESAEAERDRLFESLRRILPEVEDTSRGLRSGIETAKSGDISGDLAAQFANNLRALDELEQTAVALTANFLWVRSAWEQYARSVLRAQRMREV
jgi:hypothetical protein